MPWRWYIRVSLTAVFALAMALALLATTQTASAESGETVTTVLRPGLNLAGWTEPEADVAAIFEAIPALEAAYAWDAEDQYFRWAVRTNSGVAGDLETLTPGMGLWLRLGGDEPFTWTRLLVSQASVVSLHEGWNFVVWAGQFGIARWAGEGRIAAWEALWSLGDAVENAVDGNGGELVSLPLGAPFWVNVAEAREWDQRRAPPRIEGVVLGIDGAPLQGVSVVVLRVIGPGHYDIESARTDAQGRFGFTVRGGWYSLSVYSGICPLEWFSTDSRLELEPPDDGSVDVSADVVGLVLELTSPLWETCQLFEGKVVGPDGIPLKEINFRIANVQGTYFLTSRTRGDGTLGEVLPRSSYDFSLFAGDCPLEWASEDGSLRFVAPNRARIEAGADLTGVLVLTAAPSRQCASVKGVVLGFDGVPHEGVTVSIHDSPGDDTRRRVTREDGSSWWIHAGGPVPAGIAPRVTGEDGSFEWTLEPGTYELTLHAGECALPWYSLGAPVELVGPNRARLELEEGDVAGLVVVSTVSPTTCR